jgi:acyl-CoA dehydrogenase
VLPGLSDTEQEAIDAGTVWWEGDLFSGKPDWQKLLSIGAPTISKEEQDFIDGPLEELCCMVDSWQVNHELADIPDDIVQFIHKNKFLGLIIHKEYGGLEFSAVAQVRILSKLFSISSVVANYIGVPNSLGPGELLQKYGTDEQKNEHLPKLATGQAVPCFALTGPLAGSDATSLPDTGVVCKGSWQGKEIVGMRLNFDKRYITLAPVATLVGLAFRLQDPDGLIGETRDYGITCALIPRDTDGMEIGNRHYPMGDPFLNGPIRGKDVFVPLDFIIGGMEMAGKGWTMLVNCLSAGRSISLPSVGNCIGKRALVGTSAYARIRHQFGLPISKFEGIQKPMARIAGFSYIMNAAVENTGQAIDNGQKPAVAGSILKYHCTEMGRQIALDAADIHGGKAVMKGPKNYLSWAYEAMPVAITVEGANIMTRSLMIFGQGATRCHPFVLDEMVIAQDDVNDGSVNAFDNVIMKHIGYAYRNGAYTLVHGLTGSLFANILIESPVKKYYQSLSRFSAAFALMTDTAMLIMQGSLKRKEMISARLGDLLSMLYLTSMVLKYYEDQGCPREDLPVVEWCCQYLLNQYQIAMDEILNNFPNQLVALKIRLLVFPLGRRLSPPSDNLDSEVSDLVTSDNETRNRMISGSYLTESETNQVGVANSVFMEACRLEILEAKLKAAVKAGTLEQLDGDELVAQAEKQDVISTDEAQQLTDYYARAMDIINVDEFEYSELARTGQVKQKATARKKTTRKASTAKKKSKKKVTKKTTRKKAAQK